MIENKLNTKNKKIKNIIQYLYNKNINVSKIYIIIYIIQIILMFINYDSF